MNYIKDKRILSLLLITFVLVVWQCKQIVYSDAKYNKGNSAYWEMEYNRHQAVILTKDETICIIGRTGYDSDTPNVHCHSKVMMIENKK